MLRLPEKGTNGRAYLKVNKYTVGTKALITEHSALLRLPEKGTKAQMVGHI